ncbi:hypothetical protein QBC47DRAFT_439942 [Echria macrotheca]|uniref:Apple domain-containing protein n=1 Tax=Echria macrotheca TaxID=438768 RepID=A0AAJ0B5P0_9PEZI|nr:hypothetical protein QBC47DRAFT_439942 [Echria macrotheca]
MQPQKLGYERGRLRRRQAAASPCPTRNGTTVGTAQSFTLVCGTDIGGAVVNTSDAFDLQTCADICASFHPRCDGITYDGRTCELKARVIPGIGRFSRRSDSAVAIFPGASSNCTTLGATTTSSLGGSFQVMCGKVINGSDLSQNFAPTFQDCLQQCSATSGCAAVSFDPSQDQGFKNCYLKTSVADPTTIVADGRVDTAMLQAAAPAAAPADTSSGAAAAPGVTTIPLPTSSSDAITTTSAAGAVFFTPPGVLPTSAGAGISVGSLVPANPQPTITNLLPPSATGLSPTLLFPGLGGAGAGGTGGTVFTGGSSGSSDSSSTGQGGSGSTEASSNAWIAAPVVGSVAAIALIVLSFIMLKRRRLGQRAGGSSRSSNSSTDDLNPRGSGGEKMSGANGYGGGSGSGGVSRLFDSWLPAIGMGRRRGERGSGGGDGSRSRMGNFSEVTGTGNGKPPASRGSMRTSVTGLVRPGLALGGGERLEDLEEAAAGEKARAELRNSLNGLGQNRWS